MIRRGTKTDAAGIAYVHILAREAAYKDILSAEMLIAHGRDREFKKIF